VIGLSDESGKASKKLDFREKVIEDSFQVGHDILDMVKEMIKEKTAPSGKKGGSEEKSETL